jgi:MarR family transcriptional regulator, organic hydroperoxide resistance regulator
VSSEERSQLEERVAESSRLVVAESNAIAALFSSRHGMSPNDFRALLHVYVMQAVGEDVGPRDLATLLGLSGGAVTYLAYRLGETGHLDQEPHPSDRRRVRYRYTEHGVDVARSFFGGLGRHMNTAMAHLDDDELEAADRTSRAFIAALQAWRTELED